VPASADDAYTLNEDETLIGPSVLANDSDLHGGAPEEDNTPLPRNWRAWPRTAGWC